MVSRVANGLCAAVLGLLPLNFALALQDSNDSCSPVSAQPDLTAGCVKASTGCVCTVEGSANYGTWGYCLGCFFDVSGTLYCSGGQVKHFSCDTSTDCGGAATCGVTCPCTHSPFFPYILTCGECTEF